MTPYMRHRKKSSPVFWIVFSFVLLLLIAGGFWYTQREAHYKEVLSETAGTGNTPYQVEIEKGSSVAAIADTLLEKSLIVEKEAFIRLAKEQGDDRQLFAGSFSVTSGLTIPEVLDILTGRTEPSRIRITIPEGLTLKEMATLLEERGTIGSAEEFLDCIATTCDFSDVTFLPEKGDPDYAFPYSYMEGYLFPDTYFVDSNEFTIEGLIRLMLRTFDTKIRKGFADEIEASDYSLNELVIMASIVEKESRPRDNQAVVAGILWKRFENGVQLAADATNRYIKENPLDAITYQELQSSNPYNGRRVRGLPPSAISNPGAASFAAAVEPEESEWWYYLHDNTGTIRFGRTESEHNRNKSIYLQ